MTLENEIIFDGKIFKKWKHGYYASEDGDILKEIKGENKIIQKNYDHKKGWTILRYVSHGKYQNVRVKTIVYESWNLSREFWGVFQIGHDDGDNTNCHLSNLSIVGDLLSKGDMELIWNQKLLKETEIK